MFQNLPLPGVILGTAQHAFLMDCLSFFVYALFAQQCVDKEVADALYTLGKLAACNLEVVGGLLVRGPGVVKAGVEVNELGELVGSWELA